MTAAELPDEAPRAVGPELIENFLNTLTPAELREKAMRKLDDAAALRQLSARNARSALRQELEAAQFAARAAKREATEAQASTQDDRPATGDQR